MKKCIGFIFLNVMITSALAQNAFNCSSHEGFLKELTNNSEFKKNQQQLEKETTYFIDRIVEVMKNAYRMFKYKEIISRN